MWRRLANSFAALLVAALLLAGSGGWAAGAAEGDRCQGAGQLLRLPEPAPGAPECPLLALLHRAGPWVAADRADSVPLVVGSVPVATGAHTEPELGAWPAGRAAALAPPSADLLSLYSTLRL